MNPFECIQRRCLECKHEMLSRPEYDTYAPCPNCGSALPKQIKIGGKYLDPTYTIETVPTGDSWVRRAFLGRA